MTVANDSLAVNDKSAGHGKIPAAVSVKGADIGMEGSAVDPAHLLGNQIVQPVGANDALVRVDQEVEAELSGVSSESFGATAITKASSERMSGKAL